MEERKEQEWVGCVKGESEKLSSENEKLPPAAPVHRWRGMARTFSPEPRRGLRL